MLISSDTKVIAFLSGIPLDNNKSKISGWSESATSVSDQNNMEQLQMGVSTEVNPAWSKFNVTVKTPQYSNDREGEYTEGRCVNSASEYVELSGSKNLLPSISQEMSKETDLVDVSVANSDHNNISSNSFHTDIASISSSVFKSISSGLASMSSFGLLLPDISGRLAHNASESQSSSYSINKAVDVAITKSNSRSKIAISPIQIHANTEEVKIAEIFPAPSLVIEKSSPTSSLVIESSRTITFSNSKVDLLKSNIPVST